MKIEDKIIALGLELNLTLADILEVKVIEKNFYKHLASIYQITTYNESIDELKQSKKYELNDIYNTYPSVKGFINEEEYLKITSEEILNTCKWNVNGKVYFIKKV